MSVKFVAKWSGWAAFGLAFGLGLGAAVVPSCGTGGTVTQCDPAHCVGCCDTTGHCQPGTAASACGTSGAHCSTCAANQACTSGTCVNKGGNSCTASSCANGCCAGNGVCISPATSTAACGTGGASCAVCTGSQSCTNGACVDGACPGCVSSGACVAGNADSACGSNGTTCAVCSGNQQCQNSQCVTNTGCGGCLDASNTCQAGTSNTACGSGGVSCTACTGAAQCTNGACITPGCTGCVDNTGTCQTGNTAAACGTGGVTCQNCGSNSCSNGTCQSSSCQSGDPCTSHSFPLCTTTSTCVATICAHDPGCCTTSWNSVCAAFDVNTYCPGQCGGSFDGGVNLSCTTQGNYTSCPNTPCGTERWDVKTTTDPGAANISQTNIAVATVAQLTSLPTVNPGAGMSRISGAPETQIYLVKNAVLNHLVPETDEDYHLVLQDPQTAAHMIGEIPCPSCAQGGVFECRISHARAQFEAQFGANPGDENISMTVSVVGIGYYDPPHGQTGAAVNNLELHPILGICFGQNCDPTAN